MATVGQSPALHENGTPLRGEGGTLGAAPTSRSDQSKVKEGFSETLRNQKALRFNLSSAEEPTTE
jgi:hypothetical protein